MSDPNGDKPPEPEPEEETPREPEPIPDGEPYPKPYPVRDGWVPSFLTLFWVGPPPILTQLDN